MKFDCATVQVPFSCSSLPRPCVACFPGFYTIPVASIRLCPSELPILHISTKFPAKHRESMKLKNWLGFARRKTKRVRKWIYEVSR